MPSLDKIKLINKKEKLESLKMFYNILLKNYFVVNVCSSTFSASDDKSATNVSTQFFGINVPTILMPSVVFKRITCILLFDAFDFEFNVCSTRAQTANTEPDRTV